MSLIFIGLFILFEFVLNETKAPISIGYITLGLAAISAVMSGLSLFIDIKKQPMLLPALSYSSILITVSALVVESNYQIIALWSIVALFSAVFGVYVYMLSVGLFGAFLTYQYLTPSFTNENLVTYLVSGLAPLIIGLIFWISKNDKSNEDRAYKNLASELSQVANQSEIIINAIGDGVLAIDSKGLIALINPAAQSITGWSKTEATSLNYASVLQLVDGNGESIKGQQNPVEMVMNNNQQIMNNDLTLVTKSGKKILVSVLVSPISELGSGVIAIFRDITKQKTEENEQAEFISTASHEMRTPVAAIEGFLGLALNPQTASIDDKARAFITKAHESAQHLGRLFQDLLDVTKADDKKLANIPKVVDIMQLVKDIVMGLQSQAEQKNLNLVFKPQPDDSSRFVAPVYYVNLDNDHIREVVGNLIENAIKYTIDGSVTVDLVGSDESVTISIKDTGIGIPSEDVPHLFQKFYRVNNVETNQIGGTGLGLYLSKKLVELLEGRIWVESEYHKGSTFFIELPRITNEAAKSLMEEQARQVTVATPKDGLMQDVLPPRPMSDPSTQSVDGISAVSSVKPASTVPRGESLTPAQKAEQIARLKELAKSQPMEQNPEQPSPPARDLVGQPVLPARPTNISVPQRRS